MIRRTPSRPNFDTYAGEPMAVAFIYSDGKMGPLDGTCRGYGAISGTKKRYEETIGIYTAEGDYHNITVDLRVNSAVPTFIIGGKLFFYPVVECSTIGCKVDPKTGIMIVPSRSSSEVVP